MIGQNTEEHPADQECDHKKKYRDCGSVSIIQTGEHIVIDMANQGQGGIFRAGAVQK